jgi:endonuclease III
MKKRPPVSESLVSHQSSFLPTDILTDMLETLKNVYPSHPMGDLTQGNPYRVLVACILSLRTKDEVTIPASKRVFEQADTPQAIIQLSAETLEKLIYPVGFYKTKAASILDFSQVLIDQFNGQVPDTIDELLTLKGVGRKTANLVVGLGHGLPAVCVDVHVHRICNRMGYLDTQTPEETEMTLRDKLPVAYWNVINTMMVLHGQQVCKPVNPQCNRCPVESSCQKKLAKKSPEQKSQAKSRAKKTMVLFAQFLLFLLQ